MLKLFKNITKKDYALLVISFVLILGQVYFDLKMPDYMAEITRLVETNGSKMSDIIKSGGLMLGCALASLSLAIIVGYLISILSASFSLHVRKRLYSKVEELELAEIKEFKVSSLITRTTNDITQVEMILSFGLQMIIKAPVTAIWAISKIINKSAEWSIATGIAVILLLILVGTITSIVVPRFKIIQKTIDKLNNITRENLTGIRVIRAFNAEEYQKNKFNKVNNDLTNLMVFNQKTFAFFSPFMFFTMHTLNLVIYLIGASLINSALLSDRLTIFSNMVVFSSYAMQVIMSFLMLAFVFMMYPRANVSSKRILEVLDKNGNMQDGNNKSEKEDGTVEFKNVCFMYDDAEEYVLNDISFKVSKGETVAFIGSTGSGKSTLINLIPRFYDVSKGTILVDGIDIKNYSKDYLRKKIGYVSQKAVIFKGTIRSNVTFGSKNISEKKIKEALKVAEALEFVNKMEKGIDSKTAQGGTNLSGGQKQRISIARAVAKNPEIYIFDDSFSALDYKTDKKLRSNLKKYAKDATILIVAQRIGTILDANKIVVLDKGKCVAVGSHKELLKSCEVYKQIALSQLSKEELENA